MSRLHLIETVILLSTAIAWAGTARAETKTFVAFAGRDDSIPKLGQPAIAVRVTAPKAAAAAMLTSELTYQLTQQVHTRWLAQREAGDYELRIILSLPRVEGAVATVPFEALLQSARGERLWRIEGRSEVEAAPIDTLVYRSISRNVVSALIHDGWVQPRYDADNPPPPPPVVRNDNN